MTTELAPRTGLIGRPLTNGLELPDDLTFEEWAGALRHADLVVESSPWWLVDLVIYGRRHFGEGYSQALPTAEEDPNGASQSRIKQARWMADVYPSVSTRVPGLTYTHHRIAADLDQPRRAAVLRAAATATDEAGKPKPWSTRELLIQVKDIQEQAKAIEGTSEPVCAADVEWQPAPDDLLPEHRAAMQAAALDAGLDDPTGFAAGALWAMRYAGNESMFREDRWRD